MNVQAIALDLSKSGPGPCVAVGQGDASGTTISAEIYDNGEPADLAGSTAYLVALLPDREHYYRGSCTVSGSTASCTVDEEKLCAVAGYTDEAYFTVAKGGRTYSTQRFSLEIYRSATDGKQPPEDWDDAVGDLIARGEAAVSAANGAAGAANDAADAANESKEAADDAAASANGAAELAAAATTAASGAASTATDAAQEARSAASSVEAMIRTALGGLSSIGDIGGALDALARNVCTGGLYVSGTWYVKSRDVEWSAPVLTVHGSRPDDGRMHLPSTFCQADAALETAREAADAVHAIESTVASIVGAVDELSSAVRSLALRSGYYPVVIGSTMYLRGVSYSGGRLTVPAASYSGGAMLISKH